LLCFSCFGCSLWFVDKSSCLLTISSCLWRMSVMLQFTSFHERLLCIYFFGSFLRSYYSCSYVCTTPFHKLSWKTHLYPSFFTQHTKGIVESGQRVGGEVLLSCVWTPIMHKFGAFSLKEACVLLYLPTEYFRSHTLTEVWKMSPCFCAHF